MNYCRTVLLVVVVTVYVSALPQNGYRYYVPQKYVAKPKYSAPIKYVRYAAPRQVLAQRKSAPKASFAKVGTRAGTIFAAAPGAAPPGGPPGAPGAPPLLALLPSLPHSGLAGFGDNLGAGVANFGNGQGASWDAVLSGAFNAAGVLISGLIGSGAVNTAFQNYNNKPPVG